jgi:hypothetical protein
MEPGTLYDVRIVKSSYAYNPASPIVVVETQGGRVPISGWAMAGAAGSYGTALPVELSEAAMVIKGVGGSGTGVTYDGLVTGTTILYGMVSALIST